MKLFVADAKYRAASLVYDSTGQAHGNPQLSITTSYINGSADNKTEALTYTKDDAWIQSTYATLRNDGTARSNTDILMGFGGTAAAHHCRNQNISGVGQLDLPNLYELIVLYLESDNIDALDPTASDNRGKALGMANTNGRFGISKGIVWSSTEHGPINEANGIRSWNVLSNGRLYNYIQWEAYGVAPVKELDA